MVILANSELFTLNSDPPPPPAHKINQFKRNVKSNNNVYFRKNIFWALYFINVWFKRLLKKTCILIVTGYGF